MVRNSLTPTGRGWKLPPEEMSNFMKQRRNQAAKILEQPEQFKICEGCESIVARRVVICPGCDSYRFEESSEAICEHARELAEREPTSVLASDLLS